jgi:hypothetical protein
MHHDINVDLTSADPSVPADPSDTAEHSGTGTLPATGALPASGAVSVIDGQPTSGTVHIRRGGTSVVIDLDAQPTPAIVHWGADLGDLNADTLTSLAVGAQVQRVSGGLDETARLGLIATPAGGWLGTPTLEGHRDGSSFSARFTVTAVRGDVRDGIADALTIDLIDEEAQLAATAELVVGVSGLFSQRLTLRNTGTDTYTVQALQVAFPLPWEATEVLDTTGRHLRERSSQRHDLTAVAPVPTPRCCSPRDGRASGSRAASSTASTWPGAATSGRSPSAAPPGSRSSARASCSALGRSGLPPVRNWRPPGRSAPGATA